MIRHFNSPKVVASLFLLNFFGQGLGYSFFIDGAGPSGIDLARKANIVKVACGEEDLALDGEIKYMLQSPGFPDHPAQSGEGCHWNVDLPVNVSSTVIFRCDSFSVGRGQESGRCWGDLVSITSPNNDTLTLCGKRDGIHLTLEGYTESVEVTFKSANNSVSEGFSCLIYTEDINSVEEEVEKDLDYECECGISNEVALVENHADALITNLIPTKNEEPDRRIIGGKEVIGNEFPWQVALVKKGLYKPFCGGSLISDKHVLTAAHCTVDLTSSQDLDVLLGEHDLTTAFDYAFRMSVSRIVEHPLYNPLVVNNDYSILILREEVRFSKFVRPVCLPVLSEEMTKMDFASQKATLTGWGYTTLTPIPGTDARPKRLKKLELTVLSHEDCQSRWITPNFTMPISPAMICAKPIDPNSSGCLGDSGGPLTFKNEEGKHCLIGVVSFGPKTCVSADIPNVYARVTAALQWIVSIVKQSRLCLAPKPKILAETFF